eukprot:gene201-364_t
MNFIDPEVWKSLPIDIQNEILVETTRISSSSTIMLRPDVLSTTKRSRQTSTNESSVKLMRKWIGKDDSLTFSNEKTSDVSIISTASKVTKNKGSPKKADMLMIDTIDEEPSQLYYDNDFPPAPSSIDGRHVNKSHHTNTNIASNSSDSSSTLSLEETIPHCKCSKPTRLRQVSKDGINQGRYFLSCFNSVCNFFQWADNIHHKQNILDIQWRRFRASQGWSLVSSHGYSPNDILQGGVGDCWFLSAIAVIAEHTDLIQTLIPQHILHSNGKLEFNLFIDGHWRTVVIDDYLPCKPDKKRKGSIELAYSRSKSSQLWVPFIEKAYAKIHGSYHAISGGHISEALWDLTGRPCETIDFSDTCFNSEDTWIRLVSFVAAGFPMGCATDSSGEGIVGMHAYSLLDARELPAVVLGSQTTLKDFFRTNNTNHTDDISSINSNNTTATPSIADYDNNDSYDSSNPHSQYLTDEGNVRVLRIRNPWGKIEWKGALSANSSLWTSKLAKTLDRGQPNDGTFWMTYHDFLRRFTCIDVCKAHLHQPTKRGRTQPSSKYWYTDMSMLLVEYESNSASGSNSGSSSGSGSGILCGVSVQGAKRISNAVEIHLSPGSRYKLIIFHFFPPKQSQKYVLHVVSSQFIHINKVRNMSSQLDFASITLHQLLRGSVLSLSSSSLSLSPEAKCFLWLPRHDVTTTWNEYFPKYNNAIPMLFIQHSLRWISSLALLTNRAPSSMCLVAVLLDVDIGHGYDIGRQIQISDCTCLFFPEKGCSSNNFVVQPTKNIEIEKIFHNVDVSNRGEAITAIILILSSTSGCVAFQGVQNWDRSCDMRKSLPETMYVRALFARNWRGGSVRMTKAGLTARRVPCGTILEWLWGVIMFNVMAVRGLNNCDS